MMLRSKKTCSIENCNNPIFGKGCCKFHYPKTSIKKISSKGIEKKKIKTETTKKLHQFFLELWDKRADKNGNVRCFETDILMSHTIYKNNSCCYHHILEKSNPKYKEYSFEEWNIVIILPDIHNQVHSNIEKTPKIMELTNKLKKKYGIM